MRSARAAIGAALGLVLGARPAGAVEREQHVGIDTGGAILMIADKGAADIGPSLGVHWAYGLSDEFNVLAEGTWSPVALGEGAQQPNAPNTRPSMVTNFDAGLAYVFDVLSWVPYAGAFAGGYALSGGTIPDTRIRPGVAVGLGLDYRLGRAWAVGAALRWHFLIADMATYPSFMQLFARVEYTWGW